MESSLRAVRSRTLVLLFAALAIGLGSANSRAGTASATSATGTLDTLSPRFEVLAPEPMSAFYVGQFESFLWVVTEANLPTGDDSLVLTILVDDLPVLAESLGPVSGAEQGYDWLVPDTPTDDCVWRLSLVDDFGNLGSVEAGPHSIVEEGSPAGEPAPRRLVLAPNYPNPFNPTTHFRFAVPEGGPLRLNVYDVSGREVARLWDCYREPGWWEIEWRPTHLPSGVYFARLRQGSTVLTRKVVLLK